MYYKKINCNKFGHPRFIVGAIEYDALTSEQRKAVESSVKVTKGRKGTKNEYCYILTTFLEPCQIDEIINNTK